MSIQTAAMLLIGIFIGVVGSMIVVVWLLSPIPKDTDYYEDSIATDTIYMNPDDIETTRRMTEIIYDKGD